jgi:hypothetical protein
MSRGSRIGSEMDVLRDDQAVIVLDDATADRLASRIVHRFHAASQKLKGGTINPDGTPGPNPVIANQWGGKGIIKNNPSNNEIAQGIKQEISLFTWESPDKLPHYVTIDVGRIAGGAGGPGKDNSPGGTSYISTVSALGQGSVGGGSWPSGQDTAGNPLYYRASAQVLIGTPGTMEDPFWIDINRGQRFTALASYVAITAQMNGPPVDELTGNVIVPASAIHAFTTPYVSGSLAVYAKMGMAVAPTLAPVLYTQYIDNAAGSPGPLNGSFFRVIPPRANTLLPMLMSVGLLAQKTQLQFFDNAGELIGQTSIFTGPGLNTAPIAIPTDAFGLVISDNLGTTPNGNNFRLIYQLSV